MEKLIDLFFIFCVLAYKYWFVFIPIVAILTTMSIFEEIQEEKARKQKDKTIKHYQTIIYKMQQEQLRREKSKKMFDMLKEL